MQNLKFENRNYFTKENIVSKEISADIKAQNPIFEELDAELPDNYCVIGGAARSLAFALLHKNYDMPPIRDVDLAYFDGEEDETWSYLSEKYSPDDFKYNHGAQKLYDVEEYMNTRDFSMNQVLYKNGKLTMTKRAIEDIRRGVIRPSDGREAFWWHQDSDDDLTDDISVRMALKACLQKAVLSENIPDIRIENNIQCSDLKLDRGYSVFQLALSLQKSFEYGNDIPHKFLNEMKDSGLFVQEDFYELKDEDGEWLPLYQIMDKLSESLERPFEYRGSALEYHSSSQIQDNFFNETSDAEFEDELSAQE